MAAKLNRLVLQLRAMCTKMMLADASSPAVRSAREQGSNASPSTERLAEAPHRAAKRRTHG